MILLFLCSPVLLTHASGKTKSQPLESAHCQAGKGRSGTMCLGKERILMPFESEKSTWFNKSSLVQINRCITHLEMNSEFRDFESII